jgi:menaquinone-9 beta-reductase
MRWAIERLGGNGPGRSDGVLEYWSVGKSNTPILQHSITPSPRPSTTPLLHPSTTPFRRPRPLTIVGGGLAGLALGIGLRQRGIPVTVWEASHYPRHRVCGEFICGRGQEVLARLGLLDSFFQAGAILGRTAAFYVGRFGSPVRTLATPALCLSRHVLDALLADQFRRAGGELRENARWREDDYGEGVVRASGRRLHPRDEDCHWFGIKVQAHNVLLAADLEMHRSPSGYVGLCRLGGGTVNVCGLFRRTTGKPDSANTWKDRLRGQPDSALWEALAGSTFDQDSFCSVAGFSLKPCRAGSYSECCIGDALTMIPPVTGNGMSMAFEAAELAVGPLADYSHGKSTWNEARHLVAAGCDHAFARRLAWARALQWLMLTRWLRGWAGSVALHSDSLWRLMFAYTR